MLLLAQWNQFKILILQAQFKLQTLTNIHFISLDLMLSKHLLSFLFWLILKLIVKFEEFSVLKL